MHNNVFNFFFLHIRRFSTKKKFGPSALRLRMEESAVIFAAYDVWYGEDMRERPIKKHPLVSSASHNGVLLCTTCVYLGRLPFTRKTRKFWLENEMVHTIPFETLQNLLVTDLNNAFFHFLLNFPTDTNTFSDLLILRLEKLQHWIFTPKISTRMDGVNGKRPLFLLITKSFFPILPHIIRQNRLLI